MKLTEVFCEENIGMPVQYFWGIDHGKEIIIRGRFYGFGEDGESKQTDKDGNTIFFVTPNNRYWTIPMEGMQYKLTLDDLSELDKLEKEQEKPYGEYFDIKDGKYTKNFEYRKKPLELTRFKREWYEDHKLYDVETDVLGRAIAKIFTKVYGIEYHYQKVMAHCEDTNPRAWQRANADRCMRVISPNIYGDKLYSSTTHYGVFNPPIWPSKDYTGDTLFKHVPVEVKEEDFLLYFSNRWNPETIRIGDMENAAGDSWLCELYFDEYQFVPRDLNGVCNTGGEVHYNNSRFVPLSGFLKSVFDYKLKNYKLKLTDADMEGLIEEYLKELPRKPVMALTNPDTEIKS